MVNVAKIHKCDEKIQRIITKPTRSVSINSVGTNMLSSNNLNFYYRTIISLIKK